MRASTCVAVVVAMAVEGALFAAFWPKGDAKSEPVAEEGAAKTPDHSGETIKALKSHIAALEKRLADKDAGATDEKIDADPESRTAPEDGDGGGPGGRHMWRRPSLAEMRAGMEKFKAENPEEFARMTNHMARMRVRREKDRAESRDFLASVNTDNMSADALKLHNDYIALRDRTSEIEDRIAALHSDPDATDEQMDELVREMHEAHREMHELAGKERDSLLV
ncbi:MAG: hypothetical protein IIZ70_04505, partial [Kiritimatiellae bacterium]|nr:hypothetical protein [Kiritimatiellia bacterium]